MFSASLRLVILFGICAAFETVFTANIPPRSKTAIRNDSMHRKQHTDSFLSVSVTRPYTTFSSSTLLSFIEELDLPQNFKPTGEDVDMYEGSANSFDTKDEFTNSMNPSFSTTDSPQQFVRNATASNPSARKPAIHPLEWLFFHSSTTPRPTTQPTYDLNLHIITTSSGLQQNNVTKENNWSRATDHPKTSTQPYDSYSTRSIGDSKNKLNTFFPPKTQNPLPYAKPDGIPELDPKRHTNPSVELQELAEALQKVTSLLHKLSQQSDKDMKDAVSTQIVGTLLAVNITKEPSPEPTPTRTYFQPMTSTFRSTTTLPTTSKPTVDPISTYDKKHFQPSIQVSEDVFVFRNETWLDPYYFPVNPYYLASANPLYYETHSTQNPSPPVHQPQVDKNDIVNQGVSLSLTSITDKIGVLGNLFNSLRQQTPEGKQQLFLTVMVGIPMITAFLAALGVSQLILAPIAMVIPFYLMMTFADSNLSKRQKRSSPTMQYLEVPGWNELIHIFNYLQDYEQFSSGGWAKLDT